MKTTMSERHRIYNCGADGKFIMRPRGEDQSISRVQRARSPRNQKPISGLSHNVQLGSLPTPKCVPGSYARAHTHSFRRNTRCRPEHLALLNGRRRRLERSTASCTPRRTGGLRLLRRAGLPCWLPVRERRHSARPRWHHDLRPPPPEGNGRGDTRGVTPENTPKLFSGGEPAGFCLDKYCANPGA